LLEEIPEKTTVVLTGRRAPEELIKRADLVTEMKLIKHPFEKNVLAREGLEY
jgi:cob(I)alamin adenosyltransferase